MTDIEKLFKAITEDNMSDVQALLSKKPELITQKHDGKTALDIANETNNKEAITILTALEETAAASAKPDKAADEKADEEVEASAEDDRQHLESHEEKPSESKVTEKPKSFLQTIGTNGFLLGGLAAMGTILISGVSGIGGFLMALVVGITAGFTLSLIHI